MTDTKGFGQILIETIDWHIKKRLEPITAQIKELQERNTQTRIMLTDLLKEIVEIKEKLKNKGNNNESS